MSTIIDRLRSYRDEDGVSCSAAIEAAHEIEKLRAENTELSRLIREVAIPAIQKAYINSDALAQLQEAIKQ